MTSAVTIAARPSHVLNRLARLFARRETIMYLVLSNLKAGHRDKVLGNLWNLLDPLLSLGVYFLVFGVWLGQGRANRGDYMIYLFIGILVWRFLDGTTHQAVNCIRGNRGLIGEINFPKAIFPLSIGLSRVYDFMWGLVALALALLIARKPVTWNVTWVVPLIVLQFILVTGVAYIVAYLGAFYADTANVVNVILRLGFYASPILYYIHGEHTRIGAQILPYYMLNPMACLLESYRTAITGHQPPDRWQLLYFAGVAVAVLIIGHAMFSRGEGKFAKYV